MLELKNITHFYDKIKILNNLNLSIQANKITCLLGSSGSGKTTILRLIAGLELPTNGEIFINAKIVTQNKKPIISTSKRGVGFVFQDLALWPHFTVYKNIAFGISQKKEKNIKEKVFKILHFFNLIEHAEKFPNQLSGGQKQLTAIARALVLKPKILLMDEPLTNLDVKLKRKILQYIKQIKKEFNLTIVYVSHDHREAFEIADQIIVLSEGKIEELGTTEQIKKSNNELVKCFLEY